jgi:hypothetical protein
MERYLYYNKQMIIGEWGLPDRKETLGRTEYFIYAKRTYQGYQYTTFGFDRNGECNSWNVRTEPTPPETINVRILTSNQIAVPVY